MTEHDLIQSIKSIQAEPPEGAVDRCIATLPEVRKHRSILPLIRLQLASLPVGMYATSLCVIAVQLWLFRTAAPEDALISSGIAGALVTLILAWHLTLSATEGMTEMERCCRHSYGQILLSRILSLCLLTAGAILAVAIPGAVRSEIGFRFIMLAILPTATGALSAILWAERWGNQEVTMMGVYLVTSILVSLNLTRLTAMEGIPLLMLAIVTGMAALNRVKLFFTRSIHYEAYHI